jgi:hypothetical protein
MTLNWDTTNCKPPTPRNQDETVTQQALVWGTMLIDMGEITEGNWKEFYVRVHYIQQHVTPLRSDKKTIKPADVQRWIGLKTNVITSTRAAFVKRQAARIKAEMNTDYYHLDH